MTKEDFKNLKKGDVIKSVDGETATVLFCTKFGAGIKYDDDDRVYTFAAYDYAALHRFNK